MTQIHEYKLIGPHGRPDELDFEPTFEGVKEMVKKYAPKAVVKWYHVHELRIESPEKLPDSLILQLRQVGNLDYLGTLNYPVKVTA